MVKTASTMLALGTAAPDFQLPDVVSGKTISLDSFSGSKALLVMFICQHCPFVIHVREELAKIGQDYRDRFLTQSLMGETPNKGFSRMSALHRSLGIVAISANDVANYPNDSPEKLKQMAQEFNFNFPVCYDESQDVSKAYTAACTPDFFLFDSDNRLVYRGQLDDSRPSNGVSVTGQDLRQAIDFTLEGKEIDFAQKPSIGCNIKWKPGNEPDYFG